MGVEHRIQVRASMVRAAYREKPSFLVQRGLSENNARRYSSYLEGGRVFGLLPVRRTPACEKLASRQIGLRASG